MPSPDSTVGAINGISGGYKGNDENIFRAMMAFTAIALYNAGELLLLIFVFFRKYSGLYFWAMLISSISIIPYALGAWMKQEQITSIKFLPVSLSTFGWMFMVTCQSLVLYSRLHLVTQNKTLLRGVLWIIIINSVLLYPPTVVLTYGSQTSDKFHYVHGYNIMEKIQMTVFTVQEFIISAIYLWEIHKILRVVYEGGTRKLMWELASINIVIIVLGIALLTVEFLNYYQIETTLKGMVYSIKLKLEFGVLSKLVKIVTNNGNPSHIGSTAHINSELGFSNANADPDPDHEEKASDLVPIASFSLSSWVNSSRTNSTKISGPSSGSRFSSPKVFSKVPSRSSGFKTSKQSSKFPSDSSGSKDSTTPEKQPPSWGSSSSEETTLPTTPMKAEPDVPPEAADLPTSERQRPDRRCSVQKMYPGRLSADP